MVAKIKIDRESTAIDLINSLNRNNSEKYNLNLFDLPYTEKS